jgi:uncharacterized membrane protein
MVNKTPSHREFSKVEALKYGWEATKKHFWFLVLIFLIPYGVSWAFSLVSQPFLDNPNAIFKFVGILITFVSWIVCFEISFGQLMIFLKIVDKKKTSFEDLFAYFDAKLLWRFSLVLILYELIVLGGMLLFIVPGIYWSLKYMFAVNYSVDKQGGIIEAFKASARLTKGVKWQLFLLGLLQGLIMIAGVCALLVGTLVALPIVQIADFYVYRKLSSKF